MKRFFLFPLAVLLAGAGNLTEVWAQAESSAPVKAPEGAVDAKGEPVDFGFSGSKAASADSKRPREVEVVPQQRPAPPNQKPKSLPKKSSPEGEAAAGSANPVDEESPRDADKEESSEDDKGTDKEKRVGPEKVKGKTERSKSKISYEPQRLKLEYEEKGSTIQLNFDPTARDVLVDLELLVETPPSSKKDQDRETKPAEQKEVEPSGLRAGLPETAGSPGDKKEPFFKKEERPPEPTQEAMREIYRAQRLFYLTKYPAALVLIQRSLGRQQTALGYAVEGSCFWALGDKRSAEASWRRALELDPGMDEIRDALARGGSK